MNIRSLPFAVLVLLTLLVLPILAAPGLAHFGMLIPSANEVEQGGPAVVGLKCLFWHPMENEGMDLAKPKLEVVAQGKKTDLSANLKQVERDGHSTWEADYKVPGPGMYMFSMSPQPYWEPAEDKFIIHYTKTIVSAFGVEEGWDRPVGSKIEIIPLDKPFGLWAGSSFTGKVLFKGKPLAGADVEVEAYNEDGRIKAPSGSYVTHVVKTRSDGTFTCALPWAGWWGFAALADDDAKMKKDGAPKDVEVGGVIWIQAHELPAR